MWRQRQKHECDASIFRKGARAIACSNRVEDRRKASTGDFGVETPALREARHGGQAGEKWSHPKGVEAAEGRESKAKSKEEPAPLTAKDAPPTGNFRVSPATSETKRRLQRRNGDFRGETATTVPAGSFACVAGAGPVMYATCSLGIGDRVASFGAR